MIREDRELLVELTRLNTDMSSLALLIMDGSASPAEQGHYAQRLIAAGERLKRRAAALGETVIEGEVVTSGAGDEPHALSRIRWSLTGDHEHHVEDEAEAPCGRT